MNKFLCGSFFFITVCCMSSCSLQKLIPWRKAPAAGRVAIDSTQATFAGPVRRAILPAPDTFSVAADTAGIMKELIAMVTPVWNSRLNYRTFSGKAKVHFEGKEESQDFTAGIRVKKDSCIWVDITALGGMVHAARILITTDSFFMLNYLQKEYSKIALTDVAKVLPTQVDFNSLQNVITGEPLRNGIITDVAELGNSWLVHVADSTYLQSVNCSKADSTISMDEVNTRAPNGPKATMHFNRYEYTCGKRIAMSRVVNIQNLQDRFLLEMDFQTIEFDKDFEMPFSIPSKFNQK
jgi:hypothetical protein